MPPDFGLPVSSVEEVIRQQLARAASWLLVRHGMGIDPDRENQGC
jgi:hypothetical protein